MTTRQYISAALLSGAMFMCGFGVHAAYASTEAVNKTCWCGNAFICLMDSVSDEEPLQSGVLWYRVDFGPVHTYTFSDWFCVRSGAQAEMVHNATITTSVSLIIVFISRCLCRICFSRYNISYVFRILLSYTQPTRQQDCLRCHFARNKNSNYCRLPPTTP